MLVAAFASATDLATFLGRSLDSDRAELLVELASDAIRGDVDQQVDLIEDDEVVLDPPLPGRALLLPELPVVAVSSIAIAETALVAGVDYAWSPAGIVRRLGSAFALGDDSTLDGWSWGGTPASVHVTYSHGYPEGHRHLNTCRAVCLQVAARAYLNPDQVIAASTTVGQVSKSRTYGSNSAAGRIELTEYERRQLDRLRDST